jgi:hypothetical protein
MVFFFEHIKDLPSSSGLHCFRLRVSYHLYHCSPVGNVIFPMLLLRFHLVFSSLTMLCLQLSSIYLLGVIDLLGSVYWLFSLNFESSGYLIFLFYLRHQLNISQYAFASAPEVTEALFFISFKFCCCSSALYLDNFYWSVFEITGSFVGICINCIFISYIILHSCRLNSL